MQPASASAWLGDRPDSESSDLALCREALRLAPATAAASAAAGAGSASAPTSTRRPFWLGSQAGWRRIVRRLQRLRRLLRYWGHLGGHLHTAFPRALRDRLRLVEP